ncbi:hypothetical protein QP794_27065 [Paenibacillus sp. UMB7766-LJ446]|uniref:hypothetical protein n=1 Tax=Paenibacillus sp. UMB7766-LJ446 TaxID=3046313 RepID=UPI00254A927B|nr:hypothetical protein [Paenibacillus sp. UMB7766-LJ446]MDK8193749.1 hypothetical protein [Paenibacillus sp. UMB7766-LJ446]
MTQEREFGWDDEIVNEGGTGFTLLPPGDYNFTVSKFERGRFAGSEKMPACNQAKMEIIVHSPEHGDVTLSHNLLLHSKTEGFLSNFFAGVGLKKKGEPLKMNWPATLGRKGRLKIEIRNYTSKGEQRSANEIKTFYPYDEIQPQPSYQPSGQQKYQPPQTQQHQQPPQYSQPQTQYNPPGQTQQPFPGQQQSGSWNPGQF